MIEHSDYFNLYLLSHKGIGVKSLEKALPQFDSPEKLLHFFQQIVPQISLAEYEKWKNKLLEAIKKYDLKIIAKREFPESLRSIHNSPSYLFYQGNIELLFTDIFAVVGSRNPTSYGINLTNNFVSELSTKFTIISGLALGIDALAHKNSLATGTIAVFGTGMNKVYPSQNYGLYKQILAQNGLVISEYSPFTAAHPALFPQRSRIIAGLASGLLVTEAAEQSGSLIAAKLAFENGRNVYAIPGDIHNAVSAGTNELIYRNIAKLTRSPADILEDYNIVYQPLEAVDIAEKRPLSESIVAKIREGHRNLTDILEKLGETTNMQVLLEELSLLELEGRVSRSGSEISLNM